MRHSALRVFSAVTFALVIAGCSDSSPDAATAPTVTALDAARQTRNFAAIPRGVIVHRGRSAAVRDEVIVDGKAVPFAATVWVPKRSKAVKPSVFTKGAMAHSPKRRDDAGRLHSMAIGFTPEGLPSTTRYSVDGALLTTTSFAWESRDRGYLLRSITIQPAAGGAPLIYRPDAEEVLTAVAMDAAVRSYSMGPRAPRLIPTSGDLGAFGERPECAGPARTAGLFSLTAATQEEEWECQDEWDDYEEDATDFLVYGTTAMVACMGSFLGGPWAAAIGCGVAGVTTLYQWYKVYDASQTLTECEEEHGCPYCPGGRRGAGDGSSAISFEAAPPSPVAGRQAA